MNEMEQNRIRVYVYTAVNGYAWQGCDDELSESLRTCLGSSTRADARDGSTFLGGVRRGLVGGLNGTAVYRLHVRKAGDFAGRDSDYAVMAFLPFAHIGSRFVDYAKLWRHELLSAPRGKSESLENLSIDIAKEGLLADSPGGMDGTEAFWTEESSPGEDREGTEEEILSWLGGLFQSRRTELGSFSARVFRKGEKVFVRSKYTPFRPVENEVEARRNFEELSGDNASGAKTAEAFREWQDAVKSLEALTDERDGAFRHFLGLGQYVLQERDALAGDEKKKEIVGAANRTLDRVGKVLNEVSRSLTGDQNAVLGELKDIVCDQNARLARYSSGAEEAKRRCVDLLSGIQTAERNGHAISRWLRTMTDVSFRSERLDGLSPGLSAMAKALSEARTGLRNAKAEAGTLGLRVADLQRERDRIKAEARAEDERKSSTIRKLETEIRDLRRERDRLAAVVNRPLPAKTDAPAAGQQQTILSETGKRRPISDRMPESLGFWRENRILFAVVAFVFLFGLVSFFILKHLDRPRISSPDGDFRSTVEVPSEAADVSFRFPGGRSNGMKPSSSPKSRNERPADR